MEDYIKCIPHTKYFLSERIAPFYKYGRLSLTFTFPMWDAKKTFSKLLLNLNERLHKLYISQKIFLKRKKSPPFISMRNFFFLSNFQCGMLRRHSQNLYLISIEDYIKYKPHKRHILNG